MQFFEDLKCYREGLLAQGFWALQFHRFGATKIKFKSFKPVYYLIKIIHKLLIKFSEIFFGISIGSNVLIGKGCVIEHFGTIIIHSNVVIGDDVTIRQGVTIGNRFMHQPLDAPVIGDRCNIGAGAKILGKVIIGHDVNIGANAVVLTDIPSYATAVGIPAVIKFKKPPLQANENE
jgi:serine O-acetyltransferase